jgi:peptide/nickel transport system permease protein
MTDLSTSRHARDMPASLVQRTEAAVGVPLDRRTALRPDGSGDSMPSIAGTAEPSPGASAPPLLRYVVRRVAGGVATLLLVSAVIFFGTNALPGDAARTSLGALASDPAALEAALEATGLDQPAITRYWNWLLGLLHGDMGRSLLTHESVGSILSGRLTNTAVLTLCVIVLLIPLALGLGVVSAFKKDGVVDQVVGTSTLTFLATPEFVVGALLVVLFATELKVLPSVSLIDPTMPTIEQPRLLVLPVLTLLLVAVGQATRFVRASTVEILQSDFVQMAVLRGVPTRALLFRHVLPNALGPTIQVLGMTIGSLIGGVVVTEIVFSYPGVGSLFVQSVGSRDITIVASIAMLVSAAYIACNLVADLLVMALNPRLRRAGGGAL